MSVPWDQHAPLERFGFIRFFEGKQLPVLGQFAQTASQDKSRRVQGFSTLPTDRDLQPKSSVCTAKTIQIPAARIEGPCAASMLFWKQVEGNFPSTRSCKGLCQHRAVLFFLISYRPDTLNAIWLCTTRCSHHWVWFGRYKYIKFIGGNWHHIYKRLQVSFKK